MKRIILLFAFFMLWMTAATAHQILLGWHSSPLPPRERLAVAVSVLFAFTLITLAAFVLAALRWWQ